MRKIRDFIRSTKGAIAPMFALSAVVLLVVGGIAIDYSHGSQVKAKLQSASDSAILAAARAKSLDDKLNKSQLTTIARDFFDKNGGIQSGNTVSKFTLTETNGMFDLSVETDQNTTLMRIAGFSTMELDLTSQAEIGPGIPLEIALVLDNTGSMTGTKLTALQVAAKDLVDKLLTAESKKTKVAIVPFSEYVNVGLDKRDQTWLSVPADSSTTSNSCWNTYPNAVTDCSEQTLTGYNDGVPYTYTANVCTTVTLGDPVEQCGNQTLNYTWRGCVGSRPYPGNVNDQGYNLDTVPGLMNIYCSTPITPLTKTKADVVAGIDAMTASGNTYIPAGLAWGWRSLSHAKPFSQGKIHKDLKDEGGIKAIILMTDGVNTKSPTYPEHYGSDTTLANQLTAELCTNIKAKDITIYTIAFEVIDTTVKNLLEQCATNPGMYFDAGNSAALASAFGSISGQLTQLRLTK